MKILHISTMYPTPGDSRTGSVIHRQIKTLEKFGVESKVISPVPFTPFPLPLIKKKWKGFSSIPLFQNIEGIEVDHLRYWAVYPQSLLYSSAGIRMWNGMKKEIPKIIDKGFSFDLIHAHYGFPDGQAAIEVGKKYKKPVVITIQATDIDKNIHINSKSPSVIKSVLKTSNLVISPSPRIQKELKEKLDINSDFLGYGFETDNIFKGISKLKDPFLNKTLILSVCRLIKSKGIDLNIIALSELIKKYPQLHYIIIGEGDDKERLITLSKTLKLENHTSFLGELPNKEVMEYISICDIFSLPSWQETFGQVYIEAMANNKPVIAVKGQGVDGIIQNGVNGFLSLPHDYKSVMEHVEYILMNPLKIKKMTCQLDIGIKKQFSWPNVARETFKIYNRVLNQSL